MAGIEPRHPEGGVDVHDDRHHATNAASECSSTASRSSHSGNSGAKYGCQITSPVTTSTAIVTVSVQN